MDPMSGFDIRLVFTLPIKKKVCREEMEKEDEDEKK